MKWGWMVMKQGCALPRWGNEMTVCDSDEVGVYAANNTGTGTTTEQFACTWAVLWGK